MTDHPCLRTNRVPSDVVRRQTSRQTYLESDVFGVDVVCPFCLDEILGAAGSDAESDDDALQIWTCPDCQREFLVDINDEHYPTAIGLMTRADRAYLDFRAAQGHSSDWQDYQR